VPKAPPQRTLCVQGDDGRYIKRTKPAAIIIIVVVHWATTIPQLSPWRNEMASLAEAAVVALTMHAVTDVASAADNVARAVRRLSSMIVRAVGRGLAAIWNGTIGRVNLVGGLRIQIGDV